MSYCLGTYDGCVCRDCYVCLISADGFLVINVPPNNANVRLEENFHAQSCIIHNHHRKRPNYLYYIDSLLKHQVKECIIYTK